MPSLYQNGNPIPRLSQESLKQNCRHCRARSARGFLIKPKNEFPDAVDISKRNAAACYKIYSGPKEVLKTY